MEKTTPKSEYLTQLKTVNDLKGKLLDNQLLQAELRQQIKNEVEKLKAIPKTNVKV